MAHANEHPGTQGHHTYNREFDKGYEPAEYEHQEYPKHVSVGEGEEKVEAIVANAEEEKIFYDNHAPKEEAGE